MRHRAFRGWLTTIAVCAVINSPAISKDLNRRAQQMRVENPKPTTPQNKGNNEQKGTESLPFIVKLKPSEKTDEERANEAAERERIAESERKKAKSDDDLVNYTSELALFTKGLFHATVVLGIATIGLLVAAFKQALDMRKSLAISDESAKAATKSANALVITERGFPFEKIYGHNLISELGLMEMHNHPTSHWPKKLEFGLDFTIKNYGKTPIVINSVFADIIIKEGMASMMDGAFEVNLGLNEYVIAAQYESEKMCIREAKEVSFELYQKFASRAADVWLIGQIEFQDVFRKRWHREFVWQYVRESGTFRPYQSIERDANYLNW